MSFLSLFSISSRRMERFFFTQVLVLMAFSSGAVMADNIWLQAEDYESMDGEITIGGDIGLEDKDAFDDFVVVKANDGTNVEEWYTQYTVKIPEKGIWVIWGRFRHPTGRDVSWSFDGTGKGPNDLAIGKAIDNVNTGGDEWFWSSGNNAADAPIPNIMFTYSSGEITFRMYERESPLGAEGNSRLDVILLTNDRSYIPTDDDVEAGLEEQKRRDLAVESRGKLTTMWGFIKMIY